VIKSGGEWISSIEVEKHRNGSSGGADDCLRRHETPEAGYERPVVAVVKPGAEASRDELLKFYEGKTAKWQIRDDAVFVDSIPLGATGKMLKTRLRETLKDYELPTA
jgi:3-(methylthio)propionyl---CoA ligase